MAAAECTAAHPPGRARPRDGRRISETHWKHGRYSNDATQRIAAAKDQRDQAKARQIRARRKWTPRNRDPDTGRFVRDYRKNPVTFIVVRPDP